MYTRISREDAGAFSTGPRVTQITSDRDEDHNLPAQGKTLS